MCSTYSTYIFRIKANFIDTHSIEGDWMGGQICFKVKSITVRASVVSQTCFTLALWHLEIWVKRNNSNAPLITDSYILLATYKHVMTLWSLYRMIISLLGSDFFMTRLARESSSEKFKSTSSLFDQSRISTETSRIDCFQTTYNLEGQFLACIIHFFVSWCKLFVLFIIAAYEYCISVILCVGVFIAISKAFLLTLAEVL